MHSAKIYIDNYKIIYITFSSVGGLTVSWHQTPINTGLTTFVILSNPMYMKSKYISKFHSSLNHLKFSECKIYVQAILKVQKSMHNRI